MSCTSFFVLSASPKTRLNWLLRTPRTVAFLLPILNWLFFFVLCQQILRLHFWFFQNRFQDFSGNVQDKFKTSVAIATDVLQHHVKINSIIDKQAQSLTTISPNITVDFGVRVPANNPAKVSCVIVCVIFDCVVPLVLAMSVTDGISRCVYVFFLALNGYQVIFGCALCLIIFSFPNTSFHVARHVCG